MSVHYKKLPTSDPELSMNFKSAFEFEAFNPHGKKYKTIYTYSDGIHGDKIEATPPQNIACKLCSAVVVALCYLALLLTLPVTGWFYIKTVHQHERLIVFRLGRLTGAKGPGMVIILPCIDRFVKVDLRMKAFSVPPQKILTSDNAAIEAGAEVYYRIKDPIVYVTSVQDLDTSARVLAQTKLQTHFTKQTLSDIESNKIGISQLLMEELNQATLKWGAEVSRIEISQIKVVQGPTGTGCQAQNLLNMVTPALFPAGTPMPVPQKTSYSPAQILGMQSQFARQAQAQPLNQGFEQFFPGLPIPPASVPQINDNERSAILEMDSAPSTPTMPLANLDNPQDLIRAIQHHLSPELVQEFGLLYKFVITGSGGGTFYLDLREGCGSAGEGEIPTGDAADTTMTMTSKVMRRILKGDQTAFTAYMTGQLSIDGDIQGATDLAKIIDFIK